MKLSEFHSLFPGSVRWRITAASGCDVEGVGVELPDAANMRRAITTTTKYASAYSQAAVAARVPVELLIACSLTEATPDNPNTDVDEQVTCIRKEPGYVSDAQTPGKISAGFCQLLISTARGVMGNPKIDREWLLNIDNNLLACGTYIRQKSKQTGFDPVLVACAYNAGGLYQNDNANNRWRLRQFPIGTSRHADRFMAFFNAAMQFTREGLITEPCPTFRELLSGQSDQQRESI